MNMTGFDYDKVLWARTCESMKYSKDGSEVTIKWNKALSVDAIYNNRLSKSDDEIAETNNIVYIFVGYSSGGVQACDVGQTGQSLRERVKQHVTAGDYLEGYPERQIVYCGKVTYKDNRNLLEQVEGAIIQHLDKKGVRLCNDSKRKSYKRPYDIKSINNESLPVSLASAVSQNFRPVEDI